jgi:AraC-like DNA-binding protein
MDLRVAYARDLLAQSVCQPITLRQVADEVGMSLSRLRHLFTIEMGITMKQYLMQARLERGAEMLRTTFWRSADIAEKLQLTPQRFCFYFQRHFGTTPLTYRFEQQRLESISKDKV